MRFGQIAIIYFLMGAIMFGAGVMPAGEVQLVGQFVDIEEGEAQDHIVTGEEEDPGWFDNLIGPVQNALDTISGGAILAVWDVVNTFLGYYAWPVTILNYVNAPLEAVILVSVFVVSFTFAGLRVVQASI